MWKLEEGTGGGVWDHGDDTSCWIMCSCEGKGS